MPKRLGGLLQSACTAELVLVSVSSEIYPSMGSGSSSFKRSALLVMQPGMDSDLESDSDSLIEINCQTTLTPRTCEECDRGGAYSVSRY